MQCQHGETSDVAGLRARAELRKWKTYAGLGLDFVVVIFSIFEFDMGCHNYLLRWKR